MNPTLLKLKDLKLLSAVVRLAPLWVLRLIPLRALRLALLWALALVYGATLISLGGCSRASTEREPIYWVAQMDPNYRSSGPGRCPHGMDLIPVYAEDLADVGAEPGVVLITPEVQQQMGVRSHSVTSGRLQRRLRVYGKIVHDESQVVALHPRVKGWIDMLFVAAEGQQVSRGQPLYALHSPELIAAQQQLLDAIAERDTQRIDRAEAQLRALQVDVREIDQLKANGVVQQSLVFRAPIDGMVDTLGIREGAYVRPRNQLLALGAMDRLWAELEVPESQVGRVRQGLPLTVTTPAHPGLVWTLTVDHLAPDIDGRDRTLRFRSRMDNTDLLLHPHMLLQGLMVLPPRPPALLVPVQAVIRFGQQDRVVMDLGEGRFKAVQVTLGESNSEQIEVLEGLKEGDRVVISAQFLIDSESSKTSDFQRMAPAEPAATQYPPTWVRAEVLDIDGPARQVRLRHEPVEAWEMPGMTMNFQVAEGVDMDPLQSGDSLRVRVAGGDPLFLVLDIQLLDTPIKPDTQERDPSPPTSEPTTTQYPPTWVRAEVLDTDRSARQVRLRHEPIEAWRMFGMTMNFQVAEGVDMDQLQPGQSLRVQVGDGEPLFEVLDIQVLDTHTTKPDTRQ